MSSELSLRLQGSRFSLRGPEPALDRVAILYHSSAIERDPAPADRVAAAASFELEGLAGRWRLKEVGSPAPLGTFDRVEYALLGLEHAIEGHLLGRLADCIAFHAGAVVVDGGACLLAGNADTGKSSSTLQLIELGHAFLAEEIAAVGPDGRVRPHPQSLALDPRVVAELAREFQLTRGRLDAVDDLIHRYMPRRVATEPAALETIALPAYRPGEPARVEELSVESTLTELLGYCFEPPEPQKGRPPGGLEPAIDRIIELASRARLLRIRYPDAAAARRLFADLFGPGRP